MEKAVKIHISHSSNPSFINPRTLHNEPILSFFADKKSSFRDPGVRISETRARSQLRCTRRFTNRLTLKVKMNSEMNQNSES